MRSSPAATLETEPSLVSSEPIVSRELVLQFVVAVLAALPLAVFSVSQMVSYDGYWHVFIATQDNWSNFWYEVAQNAHPPLFYLLLGQVIAFGKVPFVYRAINILACVGSTYMAGRIVRRSGAQFLVSLLSSVAFAISLSTLLVGVEVRSYLLGVFFCLLAVYGFLEIAAQGFGSPERAARLSFALGMPLALLSHYSSIFVFGACVGALGAVLTVSPGYRAMAAAGWRRAKRANLITAAPAVGGLLLVAAHSAIGSARLNHVPEFVRDRSRETVLAFLERQLGNMAAMFAPLATGRPGQIAMALAIIVGVTTVVWWSTRRRVSPRILLPILIPGVMLAGMALAGVLGRYPFGGELRHQYVVFPFLIVGLGAAAGVTAGMVRTGVGRAVVISVRAIGIAWNARMSVHTFPVITGRLMQKQVDLFRQSFPAAQAVYVDQFSLIAFFMHHDDWDWSFIRRSQGVPTIDLWRVSRGGTSFALCRDRYTWMVNLSQRQVYNGINRCRRMAGADAVTFFGLEQPGRMGPLPDGSDARETLSNQARTVGLELRGLEVDEKTIFAQFAPRAEAP